MTKRWSENDDFFISENYKEMTHEEIAERLSRTVNSVRHRASALRKLKKADNWTREDRLTLARTYEAAGDGFLDLNALAEKLGRSKSNVCRKAKELGWERSSKRSLSEPQKKMISKRVSEHHLANGHPKGMEGKSHSEKTKCDLSFIGRERWANMSDGEKQYILDRQYAAKRAKGSHGPPKGGRGTWKAGWHEIGGKRHYFRSRWEVNYCKYLQLLKTVGEIKEWEYEPETFWFEKIRRGVRSYKPDFRVTLNDGQQEWHEVKGWMDSRSRTTLKRMAKYYPSEVVKVIDKTIYNSIRRTAHGIVPGWE